MKRKWRNKTVKIYAIKITYPKTCHFRDLTNYSRVYIKRKKTNSFYVELMLLYY